jgi:peroxiredoxin
MQSGERTTSPEGRRLLALLALLAALLLISAAANYALAVRLRDPGERIAQLSPQTQSLKPGTLLPPLMASDSDNQPRKIVFSGAATPTLLYVFSPSCAWCTKNLDNIKALAKHTTNGYRVLGLSLSARGLADYIQRNGISFPVFTDPDPGTVREYRLGATPATVLISRDGRVVRSWLGAWVGEAQKEIEQQFGLRLPGIAEATPAAGAHQLTEVEAPLRARARHPGHTIPGSMPGSRWPAMMLRDPSAPHSAAGGS